MNTIDLLFDYEILEPTDNLDNEYTKDLFEEGAFGEADCAGL